LVKKFQEAEEAAAAEVTKLQEELQREEEEYEREEAELQRLDELGNLLKGIENGSGAVRSVDKIFAYILF
jgi:hypothetical protein